MISGGVESDDDARDGAEVWREDGVSCGERCWSDGRGSFEDSSVDICGDIYCQELWCSWALCRDTSSEAGLPVPTSVPTSVTTSSAHTLPALKSLHRLPEVLLSFHDNNGRELTFMSRGLVISLRLPRLCLI
jgi:hypothetical protein